MRMKTLLLDTICIALIGAEAISIVAPDQVVLGLNHQGKRILTGQTWVKDNSNLRQDTQALLSSSFPDHSLRITASDSKLCDPTVQQYSGYLDVSSYKHLFFWFFESRNSPSTSPLILWFNGGPGCSSMTGLFFELGPCTISDEGNSTEFNPYSWNENANVLFIDQPVGVGFSYFDEGWDKDSPANSNKTVPVDESKSAAQDIYALLQLFFQSHPEYAHLPLHIAAESYGGIYAPNFAAFIHHENKKLALQDSASASSSADHQRHINLESVILVNAVSAPLIQMGSVVEYLCGGGPFPVYEDPNGPECRHLRSVTETCLDLISSCYATGTQEDCGKAGDWCYYKIFDSVGDIGLNPFDVRLPCAGDSELCYEELSWIPTWMNNPEYRVKLGVPTNVNITYASCDDEVHSAFERTGDGMKNVATLFTELINEGMRLLVMSGNADMLSNFIGSERWVAHLDTVYHEEYSWRMNRPWTLAGTNKTVGEVRAAGPGAGNLTMVVVHDAGHMAPHDQPEATLQLVNRWINNQPIYDE